MALHLAAGSQVSYTLAAGLTLSLTGQGTAHTPPTAQSSVSQITPSGIQLGPFAAAQNITIHATAGGPGVVYTPNSAWEPQDQSRTLTAADDGKKFAATAAITFTVPSGLSPRPSVKLQPPPSGNLSVTGTLNGSSQTLTRTRANNFGGVELVPFVDVDGYGLSGA
jgi:hypothetical protein